MVKALDLKPVDKSGRTLERDLGEIKGTGQQTSKGNENRAASKKE